MRIIAGRFKGRQLVSFHAPHIRPTTDRVKETLFNILMGDIPESDVLDLFSGTGNLGIEALSRGAKHVVFVESNRKSLEILKKNLVLLQIKQEVDISPIDVFRYLKKAPAEQFDLLFADPPFTEKMAHDVLQAIDTSQTVKPGGKIVIEASRHERVDEKYGSLELLDRRDFGDKSAFIFVRK